MSSASPASSSKTYHCPHPGCDKSFSRRDYLERHAANHGQRRHVCSTCHKSYARADVLKRHRNNHRSGARSRSTESRQMAGKEYGGPDVTACAISPLQAPIAPVPDDMLNRKSDGPSNIIPVDEPLSETAVNDLFSWILDDHANDLALGQNWDEDWNQLLGMDTQSVGRGDGMISNASWQGAIDLVKILGMQLPKQGLGEGDFDKYIELYYLHFDPLYPIIHRPSLAHRGLPAALLLAMISIGAVFASIRVDEKFLAELQRKLRDHLFQTIAGAATVSTQTLQAFSLIIYYGRMYGSAQSFPANQICYSASVTAAQLNGVFNSDLPRINKGLDLEQQWCQWIEDEERIRLAWMIVSCDTFNAVVLRYSAMIDSSDMVVPLPCAEDTWNTETASAWQLSAPQAEREAFRPSLQTLMQNASLPISLSSFQALIYLHALMAATRTISRHSRDPLMRPEPRQLSAGKSSLYNALSRWQTLVSAKMGQSASESRGLNVNEHEAAGLLLAGVGIIALMTDLDAVRLVTGAPHLNGRDVTVACRMEARGVLEKWAHAVEGRQSCWFALELLQQAFRSVNSGELCFVPPVTLWSLYLATLVVWVYTVTVEGQPSDLVAHNLLGPQTTCRVEPTLARKAALTYIGRVLASGTPSNLPATAESSQCITIVAYAAHLCGSLQWGSLAQPARILYNILKHSEAMSRRVFVDC